MTKVLKGTYITGEEDAEGNKIITTEKGFTFEEETGQKLAFDVHEVDGVGTALLFGNQVFFLKFWTDEQLDKAFETFTHAVNKEREKRNEKS